MYNNKETIIDKRKMILGVIILMTAIIEVSLFDLNKESISNDALFTAIITGALLVIVGLVMIEGAINSIYYCPNCTSKLEGWDDGECDTCKCTIYPDGTFLEANRRPNRELK